MKGRAQSGSKVENGPSRGGRPPWKVPPWSHGATLFLGPPGSSALLHLRRSLRPSTDAVGPPAGADALRGVVRVHEPFLTCHSWPGRQCLLTTPTSPVPVTTSSPPSSEPTGPDIKPRGRGHRPTGRSSQASGRRRPPGVVRVYEPFLACHSRSGRQCLLVTPADPGLRDHFADVVAVAPAFLPGRPSTRTWRSPCLAMPTPRRPPAVSVEPLFLGSGSRRRRPAPPFGDEHTGAPAGPAASSWHTRVYWRFSGSIGPSSLPTARHSPGHHDGVPAGARAPSLSLSLLRGLPSPHISLAPTVRVAVPWSRNTGFGQRERLYRCVACDARLNSLSARHDCPGPASNEPYHPCRYCPKSFNCERSLARHTMARHAQEESTPFVPLRPPTAAYGDYLQFLWHRDHTTLRPSSFRYNLPSSTSTTDPSNRFGLEDVVEAILPHRRHPRVPGRPPALRQPVLRRCQVPRRLLCQGHSSPTSGSGSSTPRQSPSAKGRERSLPGSRPPWKVPPLVARSYAVPGSTWFLGPAAPSKESPAIYRRGGPTSRSRRPPGVVRVHEPFLACHSRPGRQCLLTTPTGPGPRDHFIAAVVGAYRTGHQATGTWTPTDRAFQSSQREKTPSGSADPGLRDHFADVVAVAPAFLPGRPSTRTWRSPCLAMPTPRRPPAVSVEPLFLGSGSRRRRPAPPFGDEHTGAPAGPAASSWHTRVYWRFSGSIGPSSLPTARHSPGHHDGVPAGARAPSLSLSLLRGLPSPHISLAPTVRVAVPHGAETRGSANGAALPVRRL
ncbi:hypothetical protein MRX96_018205 [Rhipicephalus microplus]